ncbi:hypothetical protein [Thalassorhabdomicrobium marinisediminis]|uniref:hypothetical protein n=1 Tax=Thalassorhabdomicrobium marinisediminis TaxID=2170577 RepID=UPI002491A7B5|nr:hypothetical protein [Thalassorhabdomicrobium marinisediminis]
MAIYTACRAPLTARWNISIINMSLASLVQCDGVAHRIVPLEGPDRPARELSIEPRPHIVRIVVPQHLRPDVVIEDVVVHRLEPDVIVLRELGAVTRAERRDDLGERL